MERTDGSHCIALAYLLSDTTKLPSRDSSDGIDFTKQLSRDDSDGIDLSKLQYLRVPYQIRL